jgi:hypothetical protein
MTPLGASGHASAAREPDQQLPVVEEDFKKK